MEILNLTRYTELSEGRFYIYNQLSCRGNILYGITKHKGKFDDIVAIIKIKNKNNGTKTKQGAS